MITNSSVTPKSLSKKIVNLLSKMDSVQNHLKNRGDDRLIDNFSEGLTELLDLSRKLHKALQTDEYTKSLKLKAKRLHEHINKAIEDNKLSQSTLTNALKIHNELLYGMDKEKTAFTLKASDKKVLDAFINKQPADSNNLSSTGIKLKKDSFASYPVAVWRGLYLHIYSEAESNAYGAMLIRYLKKKVAPHWFIREYADKDKLPALTFTRQGDSVARGQYDETIYAYIPGEAKPVGYLSWTGFNNKYYVRMVEVLPKYRRTGIATALYKEMCRDNNITLRDIQKEYRTDDGSAFRRAVGCISNDPPKYKFRKYVDKWASKTKQAFEYDSEDMRDAFEHLNQQVEDDYDEDGEDGGEFLSDENTEITYNASMPVSKILEHADYRSWGEFGPKSLVGLNKQEFLDEVSGYRGVSWAERAWEWVEQGSPDNPVILYVGDRTSTQVADGQGRVNIAVGMGWKTLPTVIMDDKGVTKQAAGFIPVEPLAKMIAYHTVAAINVLLTKGATLVDQQPTPKDKTYEMSRLTARINNVVKDKKSVTEWLGPRSHEPLLKSEKADTLFKRIAVDLDPYGVPGDSILGTFARPTIVDTLSLDDEEPSVPPGGSVRIYWLNLLANVYKKTGWLDPKDVEKELMGVLAHELHHAADWAYLQAAKPGLYNKQNPSQGFGEPGKLDQDANRTNYLNSATELKSFALNVSQEVWQDLSNGGLSLKVLAGLQNLPYAEFIASLNKDKSLFSRIKKFIRPENMRVFYKRVWSYLQKEISRQIEIYKRIERRGF